MSRNTQTTDDPWNDDWKPAPDKSVSESPGIIIPGSQEQVQKLFSASNSYDPLEGEPNELSNSFDLPRYDIHPLAPGSQYRPQLRILKRAPDKDASAASAAAAAAASKLSADMRPGETKQEYRERIRREKEQKYRAARESIFGKESHSTSNMPTASSHSVNTFSRSSTHTGNSTTTIEPVPSIRNPRGPDGTAGFSRPRPRTGHDSNLQR
ncbi:hypothetical protein V1511DRAFT_460640 [Dipodascopsis uninucleata]